MYGIDPGFSDKWRSQQFGLGDAIGQIWIKSPI